MNAIRWAHWCVLSERSGGFVGRAPSGSPRGERGVPQLATARPASGPTPHEPHMCSEILSVNSRVVCESVLNGWVVDLLSRNPPSALRPVWTCQFSRASARWFWITAYKGKLLVLSHFHFNPFANQRSHRSEYQWLPFMGETPTSPQAGALNTNKFVSPFIGIHLLLFLPTSVVFKNPS